MMVIQPERARNGRTLLPHAVLIDGRLSGLWRHVSNGRNLTVETWFPRKLRPTEKGSLAAAVDAFLEFAQMR